MMGVHGNGMTSLVWMKPSRHSTVMEFYIPGGFTTDYQYTAYALGITYYGWWGNVCVFNLLCGGCPSSQCLCVFVLMVLTLFVFLIPGRSAMKIYLTGPIPKDSMAVRYLSMAPLWRRPVWQDFRHNTDGLTRFGMTGLWCKGQGDHSQHVSVHV